MLALWVAYVLAYVYSRNWRCLLPTGARRAPDPLAVVEVDPDRIEYMVEDTGYPDQTREESTFPTPKFKHAGRVVSGDWDGCDRRFEETELFCGFEAHFVHDRPWEQTAFYRTVIEYIEDGVSMWGCTTRAEFDERCAFLDALFEAIESNGYHAQSELGEMPFESPGRTNAVDVLGVVNDEITVCVGRDGQLLFHDGRNRLAIAKILDLDSIPVWIMARHPKWVRVRDRLADDPTCDSALPSSFRDHPDLREIVDETDDSG